MKILKYPLLFSGPGQPFTIEVEGWVNQILDVQMQGSQLVLWAEVDESQKDSFLTFVLLFTGVDYPGFAGTYVGTVQVPQGLVGHIYQTQKSGGKP